MNKQEQKYRVTFDDGRIKMLVATEMTLEECKDMISRQISPECYFIEKIESNEKANNLQVEDKTVKQNKSVKIVTSVEIDREKLLKDIDTAKQLINELREVNRLIASLQPITTMNLDRKYTQE